MNKDAEVRQLQDQLREVERELGGAREEVRSFRHALHLVTAHLHRQNQVAHALRTRDFWLARRAHEHPVTLMC